MRIVLLNTSIITTPGMYKLTEITKEAVRNECMEAVEAGHEVLSAVGHSATAEIMSEILVFKVKPNRINYVQQVDDLCIVFKLRERIPEGRVLSRVEIEKIGYDFFELVRLS